MIYVIISSIGNRLPYWSHQANMTVKTNAAVSFSFFIFTHVFTTRYFTYFMADSFLHIISATYCCGCILACQSLDPEYKTTAFCQIYSKKKHHLYLGQHGITSYSFTYNRLSYSLTNFLKGNTNINKLNNCDWSRSRAIIQCGQHGSHDLVLKFDEKYLTGFRDLWLGQFVTLFWNFKEDTCEITKVCFSAEKSEKLKTEAK